MPIGMFLDEFPTALFVAIHLAFIGIGIWAIKRAHDGRESYEAPLWLYVASQPVFLAFFAGAITLKMTVVAEQTLIVALVLWLGLQARGAANERPGVRSTASG